MMIVAPINLISTDENGIAYLSGTKMKVRQLVMEKNIWGLSPEDIQKGHDHLSLSQIYAALSYYYDNKDVIDNEIAKSQKEVDEERTNPSNLVSRMEFEQRLESGQNKSDDRPIHG